MSASLVRSQWMKRASPQPSWPPLRVGHIDAGNDDVAAIAGERHGKRLSDQRRAAGDDGGFAVKTSHAQSRLFGIVGKPGRERLYVLCGCYPFARNEFWAHVADGSSVAGIELLDDQSQIDT
jgi:hypothetical protein